MPRTRKAAAASAKRRGKSLRITDAATASSADDQLLEKLITYRNDLESQFQQRIERLERRIQDQDHSSNTTLNLCLARLPKGTRNMLLVDYLSQELGIFVNGRSSRKLETDSNELSDISERVKRSARRAKRVATVTRSKQPPETTLSAVEEEENAPVMQTRSLRYPRNATTPMTVSTPFATRPGNRRVQVLAASAGAKAGYRAGGGKGITSQEPTAYKRLVRDKENAFSQGGSPLLNPFALRHEDLSKLKRNDISQLKRLKSKLDELLMRV